MLKLCRNQMNSPLLSPSLKVVMHSQLRMCLISFKTHFRHQTYKKALLNHASCKESIAPLVEAPLNTVLPLCL